jgi:hypothetical protein
MSNDDKIRNFEDEIHSLTCQLQRERDWSKQAREYDRKTIATLRDTVSYLISRIYTLEEKYEEL